MGPPNLGPLRLDEATGHLANDNEVHVQAALDAAFPAAFLRRTATVIAHRLSTMRGLEPTAAAAGLDA